MPIARKTPRSLAISRTLCLLTALLLALTWWQTHPIDRAICLTYNTPAGNALGLYASNGQLTPFWAHSIGDANNLARFALYTPSSPLTLAPIFALFAADSKGISDGTGANYHACGFGLIWLHDWALPQSLGFRFPGLACALTLPFWFLESLLLLPLLPPLWQKYKSHHRTTTTLCPTCNYDLRASPTTCPECGTPKRINPTEPAA